MQRTKRTTGGEGLNKFQRYRMAQRHKGMRLLRVWVPDTHRPEFAKEAERQAQAAARPPRGIGGAGLHRNRF